MRPREAEDESTINQKREDGTNMFQVNPERVLLLESALKPSR